jgi:hypothetical protein
VRPRPRRAATTAGLNRSREEQDEICLGLMLRRFRNVNIVRALRIAYVL